MNAKVFLGVFEIGVELVVIQAICAWCDGYFNHDQMRSQGIFGGWSFLEHGGMWADVFIVSPLVAYITSKYHLDLLTWRGLSLIGIALVICIGMGSLYQKGGIETPEAHAHDGKTTPAGWIHGLFAFVAIVVCGAVYFNLTTPTVTWQDTILTSAILTPFFYLGVAKISKRWIFITMAKWQVAIEIIVLWAMTGWHIWYAH